MIAIPISRSGATRQATGPQAALPAPQGQPLDWTQLLVAGTLVTGGAMIVAGHKRAGLAVAAAGTALALLDDQELVTAWWKRLPSYMGQAQDFLTRVEHYLDEASVQGKRIQSILRR